MPHRAPVERAGTRGPGYHTTAGANGLQPARRLTPHFLRTGFFGAVPARERPRCFTGGAVRAICWEMGKVTRLTGGESEAGLQRLHLREIPGESGPPQESIGQDLRMARLGRGEELGQVSHALRIRKDYLEALELDQPDKLPGRTYAVGFVRAYAKYLGLDASLLVSRYKLAIAGLAESAPRVGPAPLPNGFRWGAGWTLAGLAAAGLLLYGVYDLSQSHVPAGSNPAISPAPTKTHATTPAVKPAVAHAAQRLPAPTMSVAQPSVAAGAVFGSQNRNARVVLHARALAHVLVDGPGGKIYINRLLHPGDVYRVPNLAGLSLTTPDGGAVTLEFDGRDIGSAGASGHIVEALSLDPAAIVVRKGAGVSGKPDKVTP
ncbi:MAG TPA: RodZ domain-containing protein [Rhizomicrobium sp.]|nr:RodZ domain-containing protein [Rhizomicrobium sp.]